MTVSVELRILCGASDGRISEILTVSRFFGYRVRSTSAATLKFSASRMARPSLYFSSARTPAASAGPSSTADNTARVSLRYADINFEPKYSPRTTLHSRLLCLLTGARRYVALWLLVISSGARAFSLL